MTAVASQWWKRIGTAILLLATACRSPRSGPEARIWSEAPRLTAFVGVTVVPGDEERLIEDQTVVVRDGRIAQMGPSATLAVPAGATRVDGRGKFLMPGIAEMHGHLPGPKISEEVGRQWLILFVAAGVTTVRGMQGAPNQLAMRERVRRGEQLGPRLYLYSPALDGKNTRTPAEGAERVHEHKQAGYDGIKILEGLTRETYQTVADSARRLGIPFGGHVPNDVGLRAALVARQRSIDHLDGYLEALAREGASASDGAATGGKVTVGPASTVSLQQLDESRIPELVAATRQSRAVVVPTMAVWRTLFGDPPGESLRQLPELKYMPRDRVRDWLDDLAERERATAPPLADLRRFMQLRDRVLKALADAGGMIVLGADAPQTFSVPGFSLRSEVQAMSRAGMTPWQIFEAGTRAPARYLGVADQVGTVAVGKLADLILVDGNPLADPANIFRSSGVMVQGRWLSRAALDQLLASIAQANGSPP